MSRPVLLLLLSFVLYAWHRPGWHNSHRPKLSTQKNPPTQTPSESAIQETAAHIPSEIAPQTSPESATSANRGNPIHRKTATRHGRTPRDSRAGHATTSIVDSVRILCLYGSIPAKGWRGKEPMHGPNSMLGRMVKLHGGHVTVEYARDRAFSFQPMHYDGPGGAGHVFSRSSPDRFNSCFRIYSETRSWNVLGNYYNNIDSLRRAVFIIPITAVQRYTLDSLARAYTTSTPYDYAFFGMRCASASYQYLQAAGVVTEYRHNIWWHVFTTRDFRNALYKEYLRNRDNGWRLETSKGSISRQWEKDSQPLTP